MSVATSSSSTEVTPPSAAAQSETTPSLVIGLVHPHLQHDAIAALQAAKQDGFDYVTTSLPLLDDDNNDDNNNNNNDNHIRSDVTTLQSKWWRTSVVGCTGSSSIIVSTEKRQLRSLLRVWESQLQWAVHMNLPAVILSKIEKNHNNNNQQQQQQQYVAHYAAALASLAQTAAAAAPGTFMLWVPLELTGSAEADAATVQQWLYVSAMARAPPNVGLLLQLQATTTSHSNNNNNNKPSPTVLAQITAQLYVHLHTLMGCGPIRAVALFQNVFLTNRKGYPTLHKAHQWMVEYLLQRMGSKLRWLLILNDDDNDDTRATSHSYYRQYLNHIRQRPAVTAVLDTPAAQQLEQEYLDVLQKPLQPLADHLLHSTYETFEKDPVKYQQYQTACAAALQEFVQQTMTTTTTTTTTNNNSSCTNVFVVGAGRGPLVSRVIHAYLGLSSTSEGQPPAPLTVYCIEKNPSAVLYLKAKAAQDALWKAVRVVVVQADLRYLTPDQVEQQTADVVVSELLGSFGCNELSPECLDAFYDSPVCRPDTLQIPSRYTSYLAPVSSIHIHNQVRDRALFPRTDEQQHDTVVGGRIACETPYVVRTHAASQMQAEQECWSFSHPPSDDDDDDGDDRTRYSMLEFGPDVSVYGNGYGALDEEKLRAAAVAPAPTSWVLTGLLGTFTADLYSSGRGPPVQISTAPSQFSVGMFSWFPLYFPLQEPVMVPTGAKVQTHMWRKTADRRVWYEWSATVVGPGGAVLSATRVHNPGGRSYHVSM